MGKAASDGERGSVPAVKESGRASGRERVCALVTGVQTCALPICFKPVAGESSEDAILRTDLITYLGAMGDRTVLAAAQERFAKLDHDPAALNGPLQTAWLGVIARHASKAEWGKLRQMANAAPSQLEKSSLFGLLGAAQEDRKSTRLNSSH